MTVSDIVIAVVLEKGTNEKQCDKKSDRYRRQSGQIGSGSGVCAIAHQCMVVRKKRVSVSRVPDIVVFSNGAVQAHELRPDLPTVFPPPEAKTPK
ncbi:hypothetical protein [Xenorhabdus budapestensis]|uniref:hypothetical protein n=1 Tax=Xenorhabdus budapestensis TaxID=290110 RepID=UPI003BB4FF05